METDEDKEPELQEGGPEGPLGPEELAIPTNALILHPERERAREVLIAEIEKLQLEHERLKAFEGDLGKALELLLENHQSKLDQLRGYMLSDLEGNQGSSEKDLLEWLGSEEAPQDEPEEWATPTEEKDESSRRARELFAYISGQTHPDKFPDDPGKEKLFKAAQRAYEANAINILEAIVRELKTGEIISTELAYQTQDVLEAQITLWKLRVEDQKSRLMKMECLGLPIKNFLNEGWQLDTVRLSQAINEALMLKLGFYSKEAPSADEAEPSSTSGALEKAKVAVSLATTSPLPGTMEGGALRAQSPEEREEMLRATLDKALRLIRGISPFFDSTEDRLGTMLTMSPVDVAVGPNLSVADQLEHEKRVIVIGQRLLHGIRLTLEPDGTYQIRSEDLGEQVAGSLKTAQALSETLTPPMQALRAYAPRTGEPMNILGGLEEYSNPHNREELRIDDPREIVVHRLLRMLLLVKTPRRRVWHKFKSRILYNERLEEAYEPDGLESATVGDEITTRIRDWITDEEGTRTRVVKSVSGVVEEIDDERLEDFFDEFRASQLITWEGTLATQSGNFPVSITVESPRTISAIMGSIREVRDLRINLAIGGKNLAINYRRGSTSRARESGPQLDINGIGEELLPALLQQLVFQFTPTEIRGESRWSERGVWTYFQQKKK
jgi:hypothetical protein